ncbi:MAG: hypothetical protein JNL08_18220 [Planctomycetes bacterium]|nr:hypothetical protein [Planctomycetota bacterium]
MSATVSPAPTPRRPRRLDRRLLALVLLVPVLVVAWIPVLSGPAPRPSAAPRSTALPEPPPAPAGETAVPSLPPPDAATLAVRVQRQVAAFAARWSPTDADPFHPDSGAGAPRSEPKPTTVPAPERSHRAELVPTAVLQSQGELPLAIIGGQTYRPGDEVAGHRIVAIEERRVVFRRGDETFAVSIPQPTLGTRNP